jgi:hypothetical protein
MDECYWLDSTYTSVKDSGPNRLDGTAYNNAAIDQSNVVVGFSGGFDATSDDYLDIDNNTLLDINGAFTVAAWVYPTQDDDSTTYVDKSDGSKNGWRLNYYHNTNNNTKRVSFSVNDGSGGFDRVHFDIPANWINDWHLLVAVYDGTDIKLYMRDAVNSDINVTENSGGAPDAASNPMRIGSKYNNDRYMIGNIDEVKIWNTALTSEAVNQIYSNEHNGKNFDGTDRNTTVCEATVSANSWELVGVPIDLRNDPKTVSETFQGMSGTYGTDWRVYRRDYSDTNNSSWYTYLASTDGVEFGKAYWLGNKQSEQHWDVNGTQAVDYNSSYNGTADCVANQCVEIDLKSITHDFDTDPDDGTGPYRYNMTGFIGKTPVDWADCRFIINGTVYTPSEAETAGYANKQIWQYNPNSSEADGKGYTTCDDVTPGSCMLVPYKGFWIEMQGPTKDKTVKLLIPKG